MNSTSSKPGQPPRSGMPAFGAFGGHQASFLLEKSNPGLRRSTPDSEALASSDDEADQSKGSAISNGKPINRSNRRTSWRNDGQSLGRKPSITASGTYSPTTSHPGTPAADTVPWTSTASPGSANWGTVNASYPWGGIWSQDARKDPPARLQEVLPSEADRNIPFSIPLQPTPKTYRSHSYSVGQLDNLTAVQTSAPISTSGDATRARLVGYPTVQRRTSRQSGLGDRGTDSGGLGLVREVDDDEEDAFRDRQGSHALADTQAKMIERLEKENAQLRNAAHHRDRTFSATSASSQSQGPTYRNSRIRDAVPEESNPAIDDADERLELGHFTARDTGVRRLSEQFTPYFDRQSLPTVENKTVENVKKAHWQTSLDFGSLIDSPQSRRHSFADVPTRHGSVSSQGGENENDIYDRRSQDITQGDDPMYFSATESTRRAAEASVHQAYTAGNPYGPHSAIGAYLGPASQPLFIVNFKCCRSDVFYIQEGTGLQVSPGDLVIVEADRGTDLGTVQHINVSWDEARRYKEYYAEEHYKWLMMFSLQSRNGGPNVVNPNGLPGRQGSAIGGMGPAGHHGHDAPHTELKPKMIKRVAQNHEIQALKDKEGNEAKAKRVCQQKVLEHRLNMEILDAEFQMDSKKLTFYYFADAYINFNSLVTDLFKIYKTRIWMSAINPASFVTPTSSLGLTPAYAAAGSNGDRDGSGARRRQYAAAPAQGHQQGYEEADIDRSSHGAGPGARNQFFAPYQGSSSIHQQVGAGVSGFAANVQSPMDPFSPYFAQPYPILNPHAANFASSRPDLRHRTSNQSSGAEWAGRFQGLSLGS